MRDTIKEDEPAKGIKKICTALGEFVVEFNQLEQTIRRLISSHYYPHHNDFYVMTERIDLMQLIDGYKKVYASAELRDLLSEYKELNSQRVEFIHGDWQGHIDIYANEEGEYLLGSSMTHRHSSRDKFSSEGKEVTKEEIESWSQKCGTLSWKIRDYARHNGLLIRRKNEKNPDPAR